MPSRLTWRTSPFLAAGTTECQIAELSAGQVYMSTRPYVGGVPLGHRLSSISEDGGASWGPVRVEESLVSAGGVDGAVVSGGNGSKTLYFSHPDAAGRENMTIYSWITTQT